MTTNATPTVKRRKSKDAAANIESPVPGTTASTVAAPPTDEMTLLYNLMPADERAALLASYKIKGVLASAHASIIQAFASIGVVFKSEPVIMVSPSDEDEETAFVIEKDGDYSDLNDEEEDEDSDEDDDEDDAPVATKTKSKGKRGPGRPPKHHGPGRPTKAAAASKALVKALKELMEEKGYNQETVSEKLDVSQGTISNWLNGTSDPQNGNAIKLTKFVKHYLA